MDHPRKDDGYVESVTSLRKARRGKRAQVPAVGLVGVLLAILIVVCIVKNERLATDGQLAEVGHWLSDFGKSSGFGGLCALAAAVIALHSVRRQLDQARRVEGNKSWWSRLEWVTERGLLEPKDGTPLPETVAVSMLGALADSARLSADSIQLAAVGNLVNELALRINTDSPAVDQLLSYQERNAGSLASSPQASALIRERDMVAALSECILKHLPSDILMYQEEPRVGHPGGGRILRPDGIISDRNGRALAVLEVKGWRNEPTSGMIQNSLTQIQKYISATGSPFGIIVTPWDLTRATELGDPSGRIIPVQWRDASDDEKIKDAIDFLTQNEIRTGDAT